MTALNQPPSDITPQAFFETWLPAEYERIKASVTNAPPNVVACVELSGDGGGAWTIRLEGGALTVSAGASPATVRVRQSVADWRLVTVEAAGQSAALPGAGSIDQLLLHPGIKQVLASTGTLRVEIPGLQGRTFSVEVTFQGADEPQATISVDADTVEQMRTGALPPMQAFMAGKIVMTGEVSLAMQIGMAMMQPQ